MSLRESAEGIVRRLRDAGFEAYFAGGCVRDMLLGAEPHDYDIATSALPHQVRPLFQDVIEVGVAFGVTKVRVGDDWFEVAAFRSDAAYSDGRRPDEVRFADAQADAQRRDFTINGLFYDPTGRKVIDLVGGQEDIRRRVVRCIGDPVARFTEDKLRLLRAVRFAARLDYEIEPATFAALRSMASTIHTVSPERIGQELLNIFIGPHADRGLQLLEDAGLLIEVLPEIHAMIGVRQPDRFHPEGDVFQHTKMMLGMMKDPTPELALAVLLHDSGKPSTFQEADRIRFNDHAPVGAGIARDVCRRLRVPNEVADTVGTLVATHMRFMDIEDMRESRLKRFLREPYFPDALELNRLDCLASHQHLGAYEFCKKKFETLEPEDVRPPRLLTGHDLIEMGYAPGPAFKQVLAALEDAQLENRVTTRDQAVEFVRRNFAGADDAGRA